MTTSVVDASATAVEVSHGFVRVTLRDGRVLATPMSWFPRLSEATEAQLADWRLIGRGEGIRWPSLDEDISVAGLLRTR